MSFRSKGLVAALEEDEVVVDTTVEMVPETAAEVEASAAEVTETVGEVEDVTAAIEDAENDAEALQDVADVMQDSVDAGTGMDTTSAELAEVAVESICARLGVKRGTRVIPALESFGATGSRVTATKIAIEGVMDTIKKIWTAIMNAVKKVWEMAKSFFLGFVRHRGSLQKHLESVKRKVEGIAANAEAAEKEIGGGFVKAFSVGKKTDATTAKKVLGDSDKLLNVLTVGASVANATASKLLNPKGSSESLKQAGTDLLNSIRKPLEGLGKVDSSSENKDDKTVVTHFGNLVSGKSVMLSSGKDGESETIKVSLEVNQKELAEKAAVLSRSEMMEIVNVSITLVKDLQKFDKIEKDLENVTKACNNVSMAIIKAAENRNAEDEAKVKSYKVLADNVRSLNGMVAKFSAQLPAAVFQAAKAGADYVTASANQYKENKEETK